jgi:DNA-binding CsgD family transcriptional regulator/tetratricopeptide (TPR) repeat protein
MIGDVASRIASPDLIGRDTDLEVIARALAEADAGRARAVLLGGEAGIGKSRLLTEALDRAKTSGAAVLVGGCIGLAEGSLPFAPIVEALRPLVRGLEVDASDGLPADAPGLRQALSTVASELGLLSDRPHPASAGDELRPEWARSRMYEAFLDLLRRLATDRPVVLAIEDVHWADDSTRELLAFLVRNAQAERLLLLITFRSDELTRRHPLLFWLAEADRSPGVERLELRRLGRDAVVRQLAGILGHPPNPGLIASVYERSEGNPFFAEELLAAGAETRRLPPTLREVLAARLAHVSESTMNVLGIAAVVGRKVEHDLLALLTDLSDRELYDALNEAVAAQLLVVDESAVVERYAFRHALVAEAAAESILPSQRRRLHVVIAEALEKAPRLRGAEEAGHLAEIAHHWFEARELSRALVASVRAAGAAYDSSAFVASFRQYERVLELWEVVPEPEAAAGLDRIELLRRAARSAQLGGEFARAAGFLREAISLLEARADAIGSGLLHERLGRALWTAGKLDAALGEYKRAVELVPPQPPTADRARVLAGYAQALMLGARHHESQEVAREALDLARATGERQLEGHAATTLGIDLTYTSDADEGIELVRQALVIADEVGDPDDIGRGYACLSSALDIAGRIEEGMAVANEGVARMRTMGMGATYGVFVEMNAVDGLIATGRWREALDRAEAAEPLARGNARIFTNLQLARMYVDTGAFDAAARALEHAIGKLAGAAEAQFSGPMSVTRVDLELWRGDVAAARAVVDEARQTLEATEDRAATAWLLARALRTEAEAAERARAGRDAAGVAEAERRAATSLSALRALDDGTLPAGFGDLVRQWQALGEAEATRVYATPDPDAWAEFAAVADRRPAVYDGAYARFRQAEAMLAGRGSRDEAAALLAEARSTAAALGARPLLEAINALATRARLALEGTTSSASAPDLAAQTGLAGYDLTAREMEVLRLLVAGRTNRQIGEELFISESTAGVHVSRILAKFGVAGRVEAATIGARLGLAD